MCSMGECDLGCALDRLCSGQCFQHHGCDVEYCEEIAYPEECGCPDECEPPCSKCPTCALPSLALGCRLKAHSRLCRPVESGPPPVSYRPPMPPEFLPVPTRPVFSAVNMAAPEPMRGEVEVSYGPQFTSPGRD